MVVPRRNRIVPTPAPRMTTAQAADPEPGPTQNPVRLECLEKISRTGRLKAATRGWPGEKREHRREKELIAANKKTREEEHQGAKIEARSARRNHSSLSWS